MVKKMTFCSKNISGEEGVINNNGCLDSPSTIVNPEDDDFFQNIESEILSTVQLLLYNGVTTFSSCQGHSNNSSRNVGLIIEQTDVNKWANFIAHINCHCGLEQPINAIVVHIPRCELTKKFIDPVGFVIIFGIPNINLESTVYNQSVFNRELTSIDSYKNDDEGNIHELSKNVSHHNSWSNY